MQYFDEHWFKTGQSNKVRNDYANHVNNIKNYIPKYLLEFEENCNLQQSNLLRFGNIQDTFRIHLELRENM